VTEEPQKKPGEVRVVVDVSKVQNAFQRSLVNELRALGSQRLPDARTARRVREIFRKLTRYGIIVPAPQEAPVVEGGVADV
jgi:hypothetical protein